METPVNWWNPAQALNRLIVSPTLGRRAAAMMIDLALVSALQFGLSQVFGVTHAIGDGTSDAIINWDGFSFTAARFASMAPLWLIVIVVAYFTFFEATFGATPGKGILRLQVVTLDGGSASLRAILTRNVFRLVDVLPLLYIVGGLVAQSTLHEQRVGDILANTTVVAQERRGANGPVIRHVALKLLLLGVVLAALVGGAAAFEYYGRPPLVIESWANANNSGSNPGVCGPLQPWPFAPDQVSSAAGIAATGRIMEYALGAPHWGDGVVTYPFRMQLWNSAHDSGYISGEPMQAASIANIYPGADVYDGSVTLRWVGPLAGGWAIASGQIASNQFVC